MEWILITLSVGLALLVLEVFIPSGGIIGALAAGFLLISLILAFWRDATTGLVLLFVLCVTVPILVGVAFHYLPRTPFGKRIFLSHPTRAEIDPVNPRLRDLQELKGTVGLALTPLRPAGVSDFEGRRIDTIAEGVMIEPGEKVRVVAVQGNRVVVRKVEQPIDGSPHPPLEEPSFEFPRD